MAPWTTRAPRPRSWWIWAAGTGTGEGFDSIVTCDDINGSDHGDTLTGNANDNWIAAGDGADTVDGVSG